MRPRRIAVVYGAPAGLGGLGLHAATVLQALAAEGAEVHAFGPGRVENWPLGGGIPPVHWRVAPASVPAWRWRYSWGRWFKGRLSFEENACLGRWAAAEVARMEPDACYLFTEVGRETLEWARRAGVGAVLDSHMGHIRASFELCHAESRRWCGLPYLGHPNRAMVERVEAEYALADRIRACSRWTRDSLVARGVEPAKIGVIGLPLNLSRFVPPENRLPARGRLRLCLVGALSLRKGFVYALRAVKAVGAENLSVEIVGATGDRWCRRLLQREGAGLHLSVASGDPLSAYQRAELFMAPTLEDGFGLAVAEAMACGLPVIVTGQCGMAQGVRPGQTGWVVPARNAKALADALANALERRGELSAMGRAARASVKSLAGPERLSALRNWFYQAAVDVTNRTVHGDGDARGDVA